MHYDRYSRKVLFCFFAILICYSCICIFAFDAMAANDSGNLSGGSSGPALPPAVKTDAQKEIAQLFKYIFPILRGAGVILFIWGFGKFILEIGGNQNTKDMVPALMLIILGILFIFANQVFGTIVNTIAGEEIISVGGTSTAPIGTGGGAGSNFNVPK